MFFKPMFFSIATGLFFSWGPLAAAYKVPAVWVASLATTVAALLGWIWFFLGNAAPVTGTQVVAAAAIGVMMGLGVAAFSSLLMLPGIAITTWVPVTSGLMVVFPVLIGVCWMGETVSFSRATWIAVILIGVVGLTRTA